MKKILIVGANGFVGSYALEALQGREFNLIAACRNRSKLPFDFHGEIREGDIRDEHYIARLFQDVDILVNAVAWSSAWGHKRESKKYFLDPVVNLIKCAVKQGVKKIINVSSTSAAAPDNSSDPMSPGIKRGRWPHLDNVIEIENLLRTYADPGLEHAVQKGADPVITQKIDVINLRFGVFTGKRYGLGMLPILLPRLKTHLVPWIRNGKTTVPIVAGEDIGLAIRLSIENQTLSGYQSFNIVGPSRPTVRELIDFIHSEFNYPTPHFSVPFSIAHPFAWLMEKLDPIVPWDPLVTRSIVHLLEETNADNTRATALLGYEANIGWRTSVKNQISAMEQELIVPMKLTKPLI